MILTDESSLYNLSRLRKFWVPLNFFWVPLSWNPPMSPCLHLGTLHHEAGHHLLYRVSTDMYMKLYLWIIPISIPLKVIIFSV